MSIDCRFGFIDNTTYFKNQTYQTQGVISILTTVKLPEANFWVILG